MNKRKFTIGQWVEVTKGLYKGLVGKVINIKSRYEWRNDSELMSTRAIYYLGDLSVDNIRKLLTKPYVGFDGFCSNQLKLYNRIQDKEPQDKHGLVGKYLVFKKKINEFGNPTGPWIEKITPCFVLSPYKNDDYGYASRNALKEYARIIERKNEALARDIREWVNVICNELEPK